MVDNDFGRQVSIRGHLLRYYGESDLRVVAACRWIHESKRDHIDVLQKCYISLFTADALCTNLVPPLHVGWGGADRGSSQKDPNAAGIEKLSNQTRNLEF
ncbi:hypothetical protein TNCV_3350841 [Trichonephila clavipes]|nr:hypothetical protein TNCV_3350841 [Trichonephila clavipes]